MRIGVFQGLCPSTNTVEKVASLPYDVVTTEEAITLTRDNPLSMLHVVRAEADLPKGTDPYADEVYSKALENFQQLQRDGHLLREAESCIYLYQQEMGNHRQRGIAALCHVDDYDKNLIKKHENTRPIKEDDRTRLTHTLRANPGPVFLTYRDSSDINKLTEEIISNPPLFDFKTDDNIRHTVWRINEYEAICDAFKSVPNFYVADGHHRSASATRVGKMQRSANPNHRGDEDYNWFLCVLYPASHMNILPYNRVFSDLNGLSSSLFLERITEICPLTKNVDTVPAGPGNVCMYLNGMWYGLSLNPHPSDDPVDSLDVSMLQKSILEPLLGIDDPRTNPRIDFVGGIRGTAELERRVDEGDAAVAFSLHPVTVTQLMAIADKGKLMPPKSTWFEPKLRSGLFIHTF